MFPKIIFVRRDLYKKLKKLKKPEESFSDLIESILKTTKKNPLEDFGIGTSNPKEINDVLEDLIINRKVERKK